MCAPQKVEEVTKNNKTFEMAMTMVIMKSVFLAKSEKCIIPKGYFVEEYAQAARQTRLPWMTNRSKDQGHDSQCKISALNEIRKA